MSSRKMTGTVVSDKMTKTVVVKVTTHKRHPKYFKQYSVSKKYKAHDEKAEYHTGDMVEIQETKPMSKEKKWVVTRKIK
ncbi:MAG: 30S ribosomal protein S17 [Candidatus Doudnabacteria bacterium RIFCSPHIGHO2_01_FULL_46_14]|uniref:Small ribosomal subunit protein uS17 n=1 Tax=Candidatus Doudnabacteria bacterium RIFCSPHIGHO2_01_FULL_46_14 TaxID=1817824 RepID=A0A1F5NKP6_9BACT|nr:ribosomal protein S17 [uncultured bacterium]OGE78277.1 MAG: 30S ribosomal protein S17 [Candidatus Doudnabacteria bacterium RIFCSPHIGHO2_01_FULL_46_14]